VKVRSAIQRAKDNPILDNYCSSFSGPCFREVQDGLFALRFGQCLQHLESIILLALNNLKAPLYLPDGAFTGSEPMNKGVMTPDHRAQSY
jgi:hypothetical protein